jgi:Protein of unknown function (DUF4238)
MSIGSHTIPRFYLEQFATPSQQKGKSGVVWVYEKARTPRDTSTSAQGYENGYFKYVRADGTRDESFETKLAALESRCDDVLVSARSRMFELSNPSYRNTLGFYMGLLFARSTARRKFSTQNWMKLKEPLTALMANDEYVRDVAAHFAGKSDQVVTEDVIREALRRQVERLDDREVAGNGFIEDLLVHTEVMKKTLVPRPWQVWIAPAGNEFVTSDNPIVTFVRFGDLWSPGHGFNTPGVVVAFPLASTACLIVGTSGPEYETVDETAVRRINELVVASCDRFVYARTRSTEIERTVNNLAHTSVPGETAFIGKMLDASAMEKYMRDFLGI